MRKLLFGLALAVGVASAAPSQAQSLTDVPLAGITAGVIFAWSWLHQPHTVADALNRNDTPLAWKEAALAQNYHETFQAVFYDAPPDDGLYGLCPMGLWFFPNNNRFHPRVTGPYKTSCIQGWAAVKNVTTFMLRSGCRGEINRCS